MTVWIWAGNYISSTIAAGLIISFNHWVLGLAENPARGTGFWSQSTEGVARGVLTEKARPEEYTNIHTWRLLTFMGWNWKCLVIIVIKTDPSGFVVPMHSGLCEQYVKSLGLTSSGFDFLLRTRHRALGQQTPPEPVLNPLNIAGLDGGGGTVWCHVNLLWPGDATWRHRYRSTFAQLMACCLTTPIR